MGHVNFVPPLVVLGAVALTALAREDRTPAELCLESLREAASEPEGARRPPACLRDAAKDVAPHVLATRWSELNPTERSRFHEALAASLFRLTESVGLLAPDAPVAVAPTAAAGGDGGDESYELRWSGSGHELTLRRDASAPERIADVLWDEASLVEHYREISEELWSAYSFAYLLAELRDDGVVRLEDFETSELGGLPRGWKWRAFGQDEVKPYRVVEENGNRFLRAEDRGENVMLYKEVRWDVRKYPYFGWRWRIRSVPRGSDERVEDKADSAAGLYLSYRRKLGLLPETVKFVWSERLPEGGAFRRPGIGMPWTIVAGAGRAEPESWREFAFDAVEVYERTFEGDPGDRPIGFALLSDANSTGGLAAADYDDIVALRERPPLHRIREILELP